MDELTCDLCGLICPDTRFTKTMRGVSRRFCCAGCLHVYEILSNLPEGAPDDFRNTPLFRECMAAGIIPSTSPLGKRGEVEGLNFPEQANPPESPFAKGDFKDVAENHSLDSGLNSPLWKRGVGGDLALSEDFNRDNANSDCTFFDQNRLHHPLSRELSLRIDGMWCTACAWLIEQVLKKTAGVIDVQVLFLSDLARIRYLPYEIEPEAIIRQVRKLGYESSLFEEKSGRSEKNQLLFRLGVASILTMNVMMISLVLYYGFIETIEADAMPFLSWPLMLMATPVVFYSGWPILRRSMAGLRHFSTSMETLISIGVLSAYGYSLFKMSGNSLHLYFDTATMLVTVVLWGKFIELGAREKVSTGISALYQLANRKVRLLTADGRERWISPEAVAVGAGFLVKSGESVPLDGRVETGGGLLDLSALTGESRPVRAAIGDRVLAGSLLLEGHLRLGATRSAEESSLKQMIRLMQEALGRKNNVELLADRVTRRLIPVIILMAAATAAWMILAGASPDEALLRGITVLVITCPCALGIATPLAKVVALESARADGILIRDAGALETARRLDTIILDKTGTLTEGRFRLGRIFLDDITENDLLAAIAPLEIHSDHFIAREIVRYAREKKIVFSPAEDFALLEGLGVKGTVNGEPVIVGSGELATREAAVLPPGWDVIARGHQKDGETVIFCLIGATVKGMLVFGDSIKPGADRLVQELRSRHIHVRLVSGDSAETTRAVAGRLGIADFTGGCLPEGKVRIIKNIRAEGKTVGMVGDGINDAAALAEADVGFSLGAGFNLLREASDVTLAASDPLKVLDLLRLSALTGRIVRQNLFFAFFYNALGIPLAIAGFLNPFLAVTAMFASSLTVIGNTLRIRKFR